MNWGGENDVFVSTKVYWTLGLLYFHYECGSISSARDLVTLQGWQTFPNMTIFITTLTFQWLSGQIQLFDTLIKNSVTNTSKILLMLILLMRDYVAN